jgi:hypothetical protein
MAGRRVTMIRAHRRTRCSISQEEDSLGPPRALHLWYRKDRVVSDAPWPRT